MEHKAYFVAPGKALYHRGVNHQGEVVMLPVSEGEDLVQKGVLVTTAPDIEPQALPLPKQPEDADLHDVIRAIRQFTLRIEDLEKKVKVLAEALVDVNERMAALDLPEGALDALEEKPSGQDSEPSTKGKAPANRGRRAKSKQPPAGSSNE